MTNEPPAEPAEGSEEQPRFLRLSYVAAEAWRSYTANAFPAIVLFFIIGVLWSASAIAIEPVADVDSRAVIPLLLVVLFVVPGAMLSAGVGIASALYEQDGERSLGTAFGRATAHPREFLTTCLFGGMLFMLVRYLMFGFGPMGVAVALVVIGPPLVIQIVVLEGERLKEAWPGARLSARGQGLRIFLHLFTLSLGTIVVQSALLGAIDAGTSGTIRTAFLALGQALSIALALPLIAGANHACYRWIMQAPEEPSAG